MAGILSQEEIDALLTAVSSGDLAVSPADAGALAMIDRLFGGPGLRGSENKPRTTLEQTVVQKILRKALPDLTEAWKPVATLQPRMEMFESNPQFLALASPGDMVLFVSLEIKL